MYYRSSSISWFLELSISVLSKIAIKKKKKENLTNSKFFIYLLQNINFTYVALHLSHGHFPLSQGDDTISGNTAAGGYFNNWYLRRKFQAKKGNSGWQDLGNVRGAISMQSLLSSITAEVSSTPLAKNRAISARFRKETIWLNFKDDLATDAGKEGNSVLWSQERSHHCYSCSVRNCKRPLFFCNWLIHESFFMLP